MVRYFVRDRLVITFMTKLSRSKLELFTKCPRCFWLDLKHGIKQPSFPPYTINSAIDYLLKQEFDIYREKGEPHPIMSAAGIEAVPYRSPEMASWRHNFTGVRYEFQPADFLVYGAVDDVWINPRQELIVVDYKSTGANQHHVRPEYSRQMSIYQWLLRGNGYVVAPTGYFVFARVNKASGFAANGSGAKGGETGSLGFDIFVEPLEADSAWVNDALMQARAVLDSPAPPDPAPECEHCQYRFNAAKIAAQTAKQPKAAAPNPKPAGTAKTRKLPL